jgi:uncharacterized protein
MGWASRTGRLVIPVKKSVHRNFASRAIAISFLFWITFIALLVVSGFLSNSFLPAEQSRLGYGILGSLAALVVTWIFLRFEKQSFHEIGLVWEKRSLPRFFAGLIMGLLLMGFILVPLILFSGMQFTLNPEPFSWSMVFPYIMFIPLAFMEEAGFRAYTLIKLDKAVGTIAMQIVIAIAFALYHIANGWSMEAAFLGTFVWAWVFGLAAIWSGGIALPTGIHVMLNVLQGLTGLKPGNYSIWIVSVDDTTQRNVISGADRIGLIMQLIVFAIAVGLTIFYVHKKRLRNI